MVGVFSIFVTLTLVDLKEFGIGVADAILIDATIIRGVLLPATMTLLDFKEFGSGLAPGIRIDATSLRGVLLPAPMTLLGDWNWYLPQQLRWLPWIGSVPIPQAAGQ